MDIGKIRIFAGFLSEFSHITTSIASSSAKQSLFIIKTTHASTCSSIELFAFILHYTMLGEIQIFMKIEKLNLFIMIRRFSEKRKTFILRRYFIILLVTREIYLNVKSAKTSSFCSEWKHENPLITFPVVGLSGVLLVESSESEASSLFHKIELLWKKFYWIVKESGGH